MPESVLKRYRQEHGLSRKELAKTLGVSVQLVGHIENGIRIISADNAVKWEGLLGIDRSEFRPDLFLRDSSGPGEEK
nr:helix-turn-helix transcriptional regulator [uncultured Ralstonia sp.]